MMMMSNENSQRRTRTKDGHLVIPNLLCHSVAFLLAPVPPAKIAPSDVPAHLESRRWWWWCLQKILRLRAGSRPVSDRHQISAPIARLDHLRYVWCTVLFKAQNCSQPSPAKSTIPTSTCGPYSNYFWRETKIGFSVCCGRWLAAEAFFLNLLPVAIITVFYQLRKIERDPWSTSDILIFPLQVSQIHCIEPYHVKILA